MRGHQRARFRRSSEETMADAGDSIVKAIAQAHGEDEEQSSP
jgi:hypothetical protein